MVKQVLRTQEDVRASLLSLDGPEEVAFRLRHPSKMGKEQQDESDI